MSITSSVRVRTDVKISNLDDPSSAMADIAESEAFKSGHGDGIGGFSAKFSPDAARQEARMYLAGFHAGRAVFDAYVDLMVDSHGAYGDQPLSDETWTDDEGWTPADEGASFAFQEVQTNGPIPTFRLTGPDGLSLTIADGFLGPRCTCGGSAGRYGEDCQHILALRVAGLI
jgi:hypothetical protein